MNETKVIYGFLAIDVVLIIMITMLFVITPESLDCIPGDQECLSELSNFRKICQPSDSIITVGNSTNYMRIKVRIYWNGEKCITEEEVLVDHSSGFAPIDMTGYNNTCNLTLEELEKYGPNACQGSIIDFVAQPDSSGGSSGNVEAEEETPPNIYCSIEDMECNQMVMSYVDNCDPATIEAYQILSYVDEGISYIAYYIETGRSDNNCVVYYRVLNIVNLPPEIPPEIIGMDMTCTASLSLFPREGLERDWCQGELIEYFDLLYSGH